MMRAPLIRRLIRCLSLSLAATVVTAGCQTAPGTKPTEEPAADGVRTQCEGDLGSTGNTRLATVEQLIADGRTYAALAQLDALGATTRKAVWLRAEALRRIDRNQEASALYQSLLGTCFEGRAQHGLGLTAARHGRGADALRHLKRARDLLPLDTRIRNDLGYALLLDRQWDAAQFEFLTVLDLSANDSLAARNLLLMAHMQGRPDMAAALIKRFNIDGPTATRLADQGARLMAAPPATWTPPAATPPPEPAAPLPPLTSPASDAS